MQAPGCAAPGFLRSQSGARGQGAAFCWGEGRVLFLDLSRRMSPARAARLWAAAAAAWRSPRVRVAGFQLRGQLAALLQHGVEARARRALRSGPSHLACISSDGLHVNFFARVLRSVCGGNHTHGNQPVAVAMPPVCLRGGHEVDQAPLVIVRRRPRTACRSGAMSAGGNRAGGCAQVAGPLDDAAVAGWLLAPAAERPPTARALQEAHAPGARARMPPLARAAVSAACRGALLAAALAPALRALLQAAGMLQARARRRHDQAAPCSYQEHSGLRVLRNADARKR